MLLFLSAAYVNSLRPTTHVKEAQYAPHTWRTRCRAAGFYIKFHIYLTSKVVDHWLNSHCYIRATTNHSGCSLWLLRLISTEYLNRSWDTQIFILIVTVSEPADRSWWWMFMFCSAALVSLVELHMNQFSTWAEQRCRQTLWRYRSCLQEANLTVGGPSSPGA